CRSAPVAGRNYTPRQTERTREPPPSCRRAAPSGALPKRRPQPVGPGRARLGCRRGSWLALLREQATGGQGGADALTGSAADVGSIAPERPDLSSDGTGIGV